jgi:hypothetical protein
MESGNFQGYVRSLEQIIKSTHSDLKESIDLFQELCHRVSPESAVPMAIITDVRQTYKGIQDQLTKIRGIHQLLEGKYRQHYHRDARRDKEIFEFVFLVKNLYLKFECTLQEIDAKKNLRGKGKRFETGHPPIPFSWFHSKDNQTILLRNLESLYVLDYKSHSDLECLQRREVNKNGLRSVSLFVLSGEVTSVDNLQSRIHLREHDIEERFAKDQLRGALTHLRDISLSEVGRVTRRFTAGSEFSKLKCLSFSIQSQKDLQKEILSSAENILQEMKEGEVRSLSI